MLRFLIRINRDKIEINKLNECVVYINHFPAECNDISQMLYTDNVNAQYDLGLHCPLISR